MLQGGLDEVIDGCVHANGALRRLQHTIGLPVKGAAEA
jgi:hypothetical protein